MTIGQATVTVVCPHCGEESELAAEALGELADLEAEELERDE